MKRLLRWLNQRLNIVATGDENEYLAWADVRLDELAEEARLTKQMAARGYTYIPKEGPRS